MKEKRAKDRAKSSGIFQDPYMDTVYGQCSSSLRPEDRMGKDDFSDLVKPNELEEALAMARASVHIAEREKREERAGRSTNGASDSGREEVAVVFEKPFMSKDGRSNGSIPLVCLGSGEHAVYVMRVTYNGRRWLVERRYSEFDDLDKELVRLYGRDASVRILVLPSKKWVGTLNKEVLESRRRQLEQYAQGLVAQGSLVWKCDALRQFLELPPRPTGAVQPPPRGERGREGHRGMGAAGRSRRGVSVDSDRESELGL